jgi:hypothetical protein
MDPLRFGGPFQKRQKPMTEMVAYCGLTRQTCPIYLGNKAEEQTRTGKDEG